MIKYNMFQKNNINLHKSLRDARNQFIDFVLRTLTNYWKHIIEFALDYLKISVKRSQGSLLYNKNLPTKNVNKVSFSSNPDPNRGKGIDGLLTSDEILGTEWSDPDWVVPSLLPSGLGILAGPAKIGKSWLALQLGQSVASGGRVFGEKVLSGPVLYLALEDPPRRLQSRMKIQNWPQGLDAHFLPIGLFYDQIGDLRNGGADRLSYQIDEVSYRLVVIDTLSRSIAGDQADVRDMTQWLSPLQEIAQSKNCAILMVDHHRKSTGLDIDAIADILGSTAKGAIADTIWGMYREPGKASAKLSVIGREVEEKTLVLRWDRQTGCWQSQGDADELQMTERRQEILDALVSLGRSQGGDIAEAVGQPESHTHSRLQDLVSAGLVVRIEEGNSVYYELPQS